MSQGIKKSLLLKQIYNGGFLSLKL